MSDSNTISVTEYFAGLKHRPTLCVGSYLTAPRSDKDLILRKLISKHTGEESSIYSASVMLDSIKNQNAETYELIYSEYKNILKALSSPIDVERLARCKWSACISLSEDSCFESSLKNHVDQLASSVTVTEIAYSGIVVPDRTIPVFKLLGQLNYIDDDAALAITESDLLNRVHQWALILNCLPNFVRGGSVFFIGVQGSENLLRSLLSVLKNMPYPKVTDLVFIEGDPILEDPAIQAILASFRVCVIKGTISEVITAIEDSRPKAITSSNISNKIDSVEALQNEYSDIFLSVTFEVATQEERKKIRAELVDNLFRPTSTDFRPFWHDMDLARTIAENVVGLVTSRCEDSSTRLVEPVVIRGEAGIGKTTLLKRVSVDLAKQGYLVFWCRTAQRHRWAQRLRQFVDAFNHLIPELSTPITGIVFACDDPATHRVPTSELARVVARLHAPAQTIISVRNSDFFIHDSDLELDLTTGDAVIELPFTLDDSEIAVLPDLLTSIGAAKNRNEAEEIVNRSDKTNADDILCSLWYLVPETRGYLQESLGDEYSRLGSPDESIRGIASNAAESGRVARTAYEIVAVASKFGLGVPMEVLVNAIHVNYADWVTMITSEGPLWGLIYSDESEDGETQNYRTRNKVVTNVLIDLVNSGAGTGGEFRILKNIIQECEPSHIYRTFIIDLLVGKRIELEKMLSFDNGVELFELATARIGHPDKILQHHYGVWLHHKGNDLQRAYNQLEKAVDCASYPNTPSTKDTHIKTSQAAVIVQMVKSGQQDPELGLDLVKEHLRAFANKGVSDPYSSHILANMLFDLSERDNIPSQVATASLAEALAEIQNALQRVGVNKSRRPRKSSRDIEALRSLRKKIIDSVANINNLESLAIKMFEESGSQDGFHLYFQIVFSKAASTGKGGDYNVAYQYINDSINLCSTAGANIIPDLYNDRADVVIRWQVHGMKNNINWPRLKSDLEYVLRSPNYAKGLLGQFYYAVACYHNGDISDANSTFSAIRRKNPDNSSSPWLVRCAYLGKEGSPKRFQGIVGGTHGYEYLEINELEDSVKVSKDHKVGSVGSTVHAYIGFSFRGTIILRVKPELEIYDLP
jgi:hypothetical protein